MKKIIIFFIIYLLPLIIIAQESIIKKGDVLYLSNTVIVKFKEDFSTQEIQQKINTKLKKKVVLEVEPIFSEFEHVLKKGQDPFGRVYKIKLEDGNDPFIISNKISKLREIEWAEPKFIREVTYNPNDSIFLAGTQINLSQIYAIQAWDITKGDSNVVIGIIDTGVDWQHPDISANIYRDKNGNIVGYDFGGLNGTPDNDPSEDKPPIIINIGYHGTHVAGIATAVTDNLIGIASIGYNCSIMPVKVSRNDKRNSQGEPYIYYGFEGIKYAAEHGAKIINCSWGGYGYSRYEQEIIDYAISKGALIIASAGNENKKSPFYPASYNGVLSVGWLDNDGLQRAFYGSSGSNYGYTIDVFAPGTSIISTWPTISGQKYKQISGSSMSAPHVAGLAGLILSRFPELNPLQVAERIRMTCDDIYEYNADSLKYLLGRGRINAFKAVKDTPLISIRAINTKFIDKGNENGLLENGEQVFVNITFQNFLDFASNISVELFCTDPYIQIVNNNFTINQLNTLETTTNTNNEFSFIVLKGAPYNHTVNFMLKYSGNNYSDFQWFSVRINPTYDTHVANKISMTVTSKGTLGFNDYPDNQEGIGFKYKGGDNLMFEGAFMYGISETKVMDAARETYNQREDFRIIDQFKIIRTNGDEIGTTIFDDYNFGAGRLGIETTLKSYSFNQPPYDNFIILVMNLKNTTSEDINGLYAGYFFDWDIPAESAEKDSVNYDEIDNFGYAYCVDKSLNQPYTGVALISSDKFGFYPIYNEITLFDINLGGFTKKDKWISLSSGIVKGGAGVADVSFTISGGPFNIPAGETLPVAFALTAGENLNELRTAIRLSKEKYQSIISDIEEKITLPRNLALYQNYPNPFNTSTMITYELPEENQVILKVYDLLGREIATLVNEQKQAGRYNVKFNGANLTSGIYVYTLRAGNNLIVKKMTLIK